MQSKHHLYLIWPRSSGSFSLPTIIISRNLISKRGFCPFYWKRQSNVKSQRYPSSHLQMVVKKGRGYTLQWAFWVCSLCLSSFGVCLNVFFFRGRECLQSCVCRSVKLNAFEVLPSVLDADWRASLFPISRPGSHVEGSWWIGWLRSLPEFRLFLSPSLLVSHRSYLSPSLLLFLSSSLLITEVEALCRMETVSLSHTQISWICRWFLPEHILVHEEQPMLSFHRLLCEGTLEGEDKGGWAKPHFFISPPDLFNFAHWNDQAWWAIYQAGLYSCWTSSSSVD